MTPGWIKEISVCLFSSSNHGFIGPQSLTVIRGHVFFSSQMVIGIKYPKKK